MLPPTSAASIFWWIWPVSEHVVCQLSSWYRWAETAHMVHNRFVLLFCTATFVVVSIPNWSYKEWQKRKGIADWNFDGYGESWLLSRWEDTRQRLKKSIGEPPRDWREHWEESSPGGGALGGFMILEIAGSQHRGFIQFESQKSGGLFKGLSMTLLRKQYSNGFTSNPLAERLLLGLTITVLVSQAEVDQAERGCL